MFHNARQCQINVGCPKQNVFRGLLCSLLSRGVPPLGKRIEGVADPTRVNVEFDGASRQRRQASLRGREVEALEGTGGAVIKQRSGHKAAHLAKHIHTKQTHAQCTTSNLTETLPH